MRKTLFTALLISLLAGCTIHKIDVQQGNVLTQESVSQLELGMSRQQVRYVLGSPMLSDPFHHQRWDYLYNFRHGVSGEVTRYRLVLTFDKGDDTLANIEKIGDIPLDYKPPVTRQ